MNKKDLGKLGEEIAINYFKSKGYKIIEKGFRKRFGEIDLICEKDDSIIFVEVRTKRDSNLLSPEESITKRKIENYKKLALEYLINSKRKFKDIKFDFLGIKYKSEKDFELIHIENFID